MTRAEFIAQGLYKHAEHVLEKVASEEGASRDNGSTVSRALLSSLGSIPGMGIGAGVGGIGGALLGAATKSEPAILAGALLGLLGGAGLGHVAGSYVGGAVGKGLDEALPSTKKEIPAAAKWGLGALVGAAAAGIPAYVNRNRIVDYARKGIKTIPFSGIGIHEPLRPRYRFTPDMLRKITQRANADVALQTLLGGGLGAAATTYPFHQD